MGTLILPKLPKTYRFIAKKIGKIEVLSAAGSAKVTAILAMGLPPPTLPIYSPQSAATRLQSKAVGTP